ncbi:MAG TPA: hypothetical protein VK845_07980, partial [Gemmatimonadales bacterium]|nr:hypothetical protein [Gemmatimonadales bacterium]
PWRVHCPSCLFEGQRFAATTYRVVNRSRGFLLSWTPSWRGDLGSDGRAEVTRLPELPVGTGVIQQKASDAMMVGVPA